MPSRNVVKEYVPESYYHVYARGVSKQKIFLEAADYHHFYRLFARYLSTEKAHSKTGEPYPNFRRSVKLVAYCLMKNHFHLLVYQKDIDGLQKIMRSVMTSYSRYFNLKYKKSGPVFESRYKAVRVDSDQYLEHISRYIHLNPRYWENYRNSSLKYYLGRQPSPEWLDIKPVMSLFRSKEEYYDFVSDYEGMRDELNKLKDQLANREQAI